MSCTNIFYPQTLHTIFSKYIIATTVLEVAYSYFIFGIKKIFEKQQTKGIRPNSSLMTVIPIDKKSHLIRYSQNATSRLRKRNDTAILRCTVGQHTIFSSHTRRYSVAIVSPAMP